MFRKMSVIWIVFFVFGFTGPADSADVIRYNGSSTILKAIMYEASRQFEAQEGVKFDLKGKSTGFGIEKLLAGECDIAGGGRPLKPEEKEKGLSEMKLFLDAYAFIVHKSNPITKISVAQLKDIFKGNLNQWDELNGPKGKKIVIVSPPEMSAHYKNAIKILGIDGLPENSIKVDVTPNVSKKVKAFPVSIGWLSYATVAGEKDIKILALTDADQEIGINNSNVASGKYPYQQAMYLYTKGEPAGDVKKFIEFLQGEKGRKIITDSGFFLNE